MKIKTAYIDYLREKMSLFELQNIAQLDIEELNIQSDDLYNFAYILDKDKDNFETFVKQLGKISIEFGFIKNLLEIKECNIKDYLAYKVAMMLKSPDELMVNRLTELQDFYEFLEEQSNNDIAKFLPAFKKSEFIFEDISNVFTRFYKNKELADQIMFLYYQIEYEREHHSPDEIKEKLLLLRSSLEQLTLPVAMPLGS